MSAWIKMISDEDANSELREALDLARTPHGTVDNVMRVHSLRPKTMKGHVLLYRSLLHEPSNSLPEWLQETIGSYVSMLNNCDYSRRNHWSNACHLIGDPVRALEIEAALGSGKLESAFCGAERSMLEYARNLTLAPGEMEESHVAAMKDNGVSDQEILEVNQIVAYFGYVNRLLNGLGVTTEGDVIGYYSEDKGEAA